jgi:rubrerythrin
MEKQKSTDSSAKKGKPIHAEPEQVTELLYQMLQTELGGVQIYTTALRCAVNSDLKKEWEKYLQQTQRHVEIVETLFQTHGLNTEVQTPGRKIVKHIGESLVAAMQMALENGDKAAAELVAAECVVLAETKDHLNWELFGEVAKHISGEGAKSVRDAVTKVEEEEDEHLYHSAGFCRELWFKALSLPAVLPPPEEKKHVKSALEAARVKEQRKEMAKH